MQVRELPMRCDVELQMMASFIFLSTTVNMVTALKIQMQVNKLRRPFEM